jgi:glycosyltransferase involved in cell wall biosynthesis
LTGGATAAAPSVVAHERLAGPGHVDLSIVIPAFNEEGRLPATLEAVAAWLDGSGLAGEVIVAENGSSDATAAVARSFEARLPRLQVLEGLPRGKGVALREGMLAASGASRFLCDADLSMPIDDVRKFLSALELGADVAIGSREAPGARRFGEPAYRHLMGRVFNGLVKLLAVRGIEDTQCGFKMFTARAAEDLFTRAKLPGWGFDPEILYLARKRGYRISEVPIDWHYNADSRIEAVTDSVAMILDLVRVRLNDWRGEYDD